MIHREALRYRTTVFTTRQQLISRVIYSVSEHTCTSNPTTLIIRLIHPYQVMALPLHLLLGLIGVNRKQKAGLAALFCLGFFIIAVALVRVFQTRATKQHHVDPIWLALWSQIEASVGGYTLESISPSELKRCPLSSCRGIVPSLFRLATQ